jgi:hypothetical protein
MRKNNKNSHKRPGAGKKSRQMKVYEAPGSGFATRMPVKLVYEDLLTIAPGTTYGSYVFRGNSLFDPDYSGTGHQPRFFDQFAAVYGRYKVLSSSIVVEAINTAGGSGSGAVFSITPNTEIITFTSWPQAAELPLARVSQIVPISSVYPFRLTHKATTTGVCGLLKNQVNDEDWSALTGANPVQIWYWNINTAAVNPAVNVAITIRVRITYDALMYDRLDVGMS